MVKAPITKFNSIVYVQKLTRMIPNMQKTKAEKTNCTRKWAKEIPRFRQQL